MRKQISTVPPGAAMCCATCRHWYADRQGAICRVHQVRLTGDRRRQVCNYWDLEAYETEARAYYERASGWKAEEN